MRYRNLCFLAVALIFLTGFVDVAEAGRRCCRCRRACTAVYVRSSCSWTPAYYFAPWCATAAPWAAPSTLQPRLQAFAATTFPNVPRPEPTSHTFHDCPPEGDLSGDTILNLRKNRDDEGDFVAVPFDTILNLPQPPPRVNQVFRKNWGVSDAQAVARYEGTPVQVEGYLANARQEKGEKCNCNGGPNAEFADPKMCDIHVWLTGQPDKDRTRAVIIEVTPRGKEKHPAWTETALKQLAGNDTRVRISGWLMFDQDHYDQLDRTRGTLWEVHPIMQIEVQQGDQWIKLDDLQ